MIRGDKTFTAKDNSFQVAFEGEPTYSNQVIPKALGDVEMTSYMYERSSNEVHMVSFSDYEEAYVYENEPMHLLTGGRDGALESLGLKEVDTETVGELQGHMSVDFSAHNEQFYVVYKLVLVNNRLYQVAILKEEEAVDKKFAKAFMKSFRLLDA
tara:strand:+ start:2857 stop:3321 length:465 start_codon:yes stop_codon:yes gene_type:complete